MTDGSQYDEQAQRRQTAEIVMYWMRRRGLTRQVFADRLGKSLSWVDKIKNGDRSLDRLSVLKQIARVLDIPLATLINPEQTEQQVQCPNDSEITAIRSALRRYDAITNVFRPNGDVLPEPNLTRLSQTVRYGWMAFQVSDYTAVGQLLPDLIRDAQAAVWQLDGDEKRTALARLAWTYLLTASAANKLGDAQLDWLATDRAIQIAEQTEDLTLIGTAARYVVKVLTYVHRGSDALALARSAADRLSPHLATAGPAFVSAYGMLLLEGSMTAAHLYQEADARDLQAEALAVARDLGDDRNEDWSAFGPTNVRIWQVCALADMQAGGRVVEAAEAIERADLARLPKERRASHLLDLTRGYLQAGQRDQAATAVLNADQIAPAEIRCRQSTRDLLTDLMHAYPRRSSPPIQLVKVAAAAGVTV